MLARPDDESGNFFTVTFATVSTKFNHRRRLFRRRRFRGEHQATFLAFAGFLAPVSVHSACLIVVLLLPSIAVGTSFWLPP
jgi:hypothetical protein